jgi:hypothetical protein
MKYTIKLNRGYWELRDSRNRLIALASQCVRLVRKLELWKLQRVAPTETP